jgi:hypothetical protein
MPKLIVDNQFTHIEHYNTEDVNGKKSYGWANIVTMDKDTALKNADNYGELIGAASRHPLQGLYC